MFPLVTADVMGQFVPLFVGGMFTLVGGSFAYAGLKTRRSWKRFMDSAVSTQAQVISLCYRTSGSMGSSSRSGYYVPLLRFSLPDDRIVEAETSFGTNPAQAQPGEIVPVRYDPERPTKVELATGLGQGGLFGIFFVIFGLFFALIGLAVLVGYVAFSSLVELP